MRNQQDLEAIAARRGYLDHIARRRMEEEQRRFRAEIDAAGIGPPKPQPPGGWTRTSDWGLQSMRERLWWELRKRRFP